MILLPSAWSSWDDWKLRAVLAHELAHIQRMFTLGAERGFPLRHSILTGFSSRGQLLARDYIRLGVRQRFR